MAKTALVISIGSFVVGFNVFKFKILIPEVWSKVETIYGIAFGIKTYLRG